MNEHHGEVGKFAVGEGLLKDEHHRVLPQVELVAASAEVAEHRATQSLGRGVVVFCRIEQEGRPHEAEEGHAAVVEEAAFGEEDEGQKHEAEKNGRRHPFRLLAALEAALLAHEPGQCADGEGEVAGVRAVVNAGRILRKRRHDGHEQKGNSTGDGEGEGELAPIFAAELP